MAHLFWKLKLDSQRRDLWWRLFQFHILTDLVEIEPLKRGFAGTSASMCSVQGTVIQGLQSCSDCISGVGSEYLFCNFSFHLTHPHVKSKHILFSAHRNDWCLHLGLLAFLPFIFLALQVTYQVWNRVLGHEYWVLMFWVLSEEHTRSSFKSMHYFYYNYFYCSKP